MGLALASVGWGTNQFAPLLLVYRQAVPLSQATVEGTFGVYALGLVPGLLVAGRLADRWGRRRVLMPSLVLSFAASAILVAGRDTVGLLLAGRFVMGLAAAGAFGSGVAWVKELSEDRPGAAAQRATVMMTAGFAAGPFVAGLVAQWAPYPRVVPYVPHLLLTLVGVALVHSVSHTWQRPERPSSVVPEEVRTARFRHVIAPLAPWVFGSAAVALAYLPSLVAPALGGAALAYTSVVTLLTALAGIAVQPLARRLHHRRRPRLLAAALSLVVIGLVVGSLAAALSSPAAVVIAAVFLGGGYGACQVCGLIEVQQLTSPSNLGSVTAVYQALTYLGFALPYLLALGSNLATPPQLLLAVAVLVALTMAWILPRAFAIPLDDDDDVPSHEDGGRLDDAKGRTSSEASKR